MKSGKGRTVNIHEAKTHLSKLIEQVENGDEILIARAGRPVARLIPFAKPGKRPIGLDADKDFYIAPDFDAPLSEDILRDFEG